MLFKHEILNSAFTNNNQYGYCSGQSTITLLLLATITSIPTKKNINVSLLLFDLHKPVDSVAYIALINYSTVLTYQCT